KERKPIMVHVNPDNPAESVLDRDIRWALVLLFVPFALGFGGVGVGALWFLVRTVRGSPPTARAKGAVRSSATARASSDPRSGLLMMWIFAFFWNVITLPIAILVVRDVVMGSGEWGTLLVLLFPLVGILVLWGAIASTVGLWRRGHGALSLQGPDPRVGAPLQGSISFPRGVNSGDAFKVALVCTKTS